MKIILYNNHQFHVDSKNRVLIPYAGNNKKLEAILIFHNGIQKTPVSLNIVSQVYGEKILVWRKNRRKRTETRIGHRPYYTLCNLEVK